MRLQIRDATFHDLLQVARIERLSYGQPWSLDSFKHELSLPFSRTLVASEVQSDATIVGGFLCRWLVADESHILNIAVHPDWRRQGIGAGLMREVIAEAKAKKAGFIALEVRRSNLAARGLYRKFDFTERRLRRNYYGLGEDAIVMELRLSNGA